MKRFAFPFFLLACAAVSLAACDPISQGDEDERRTAVRFKFETAPFTKGSEVTGNSLSASAKVRIAATGRDAAGNIFIPSYYLDGSDDPTTAWMQYNSGSWETEDGKLYFPLGDYSMDFLALATDNVADWPDAWTPSLDSRGAALGAIFSEVDTYTNQMDLLFGAANGVVAGNAEANISLSHAQALISFEVITNPPVENVDILFLNEDGFDEYISSISHPSAVTEDYVLLKTKGTFKIDNSRNILAAGWFELKPDASSFRITVSDKPVTLLVPEQIAPPFILYYTYGGEQYKYNINPPPPGGWIMGQKYVYKITINNVEDPDHLI
jgi:hypothetical protein